MVYVGANDGMLHAFNAADGVERLAFIPGAVFSNLPELTKPAYTHQFYVDGTPTVNDVFYSGAWHSVLVGGLNRGGKSIYALDVTNPNGFSETNATSVFKWEYTDADLGYTYSRPTLARLANGQWAAIFGNGYNATGSGHAILYLVNVADGTLIKKIDTGVGTTATPNGLATPIVIDNDRDSNADYVYAGDLKGNMWKFNLTTNNTSNWDVAYKVGGVPKPLFVAKDSGGTVQPITEKPTVGAGPQGRGFIVLFGTGKFLELTDKIPTQTQSFYGVIDQNTGVAATDMVTSRSVLTQQTILVQQNSTFTGPAGTTTTPIRVTSANPVGGATPSGWYMDLLTPVNIFNGEMQVSDPILRSGRVLFTTLIPDANPCSPGGTSWLMEMNALTGGRLTESPFDNNRDGSFTDADMVTVTLPDGTTVTVPVSSVQSQVGIAQRPGLLSGASSDYAYLSGTTQNAGGTNLQIEVFNPPVSARGRQSWRQVK